MIHYTFQQNNHLFFVSVFVVLFFVFCFAVSNVIEWILRKIGWAHSFPTNVFSVFAFLFQFALLKTSI